MYNDTLSLFVTFTHPTSPTNPFWQTSEMGSRSQKWDLELRVRENVISIVFFFYFWRFFMAPDVSIHRNHGSVVVSALACCLGGLGSIPQREGFFSQVPGSEAHPASPK